MSRNWVKVEELYHAALERPPKERDAFVRGACGEDEGLQGEVLSLLALEPEAERLMEQPAVAAATQSVAVVRGRRLGPYEVTAFIGAGGMGEVYRARDTRLGRDVAIKVLPEHVAHDPDALARFRREARAVGALSHPHIAALHDIGETDGTHYLVMELLEGETLAARLRRGTPPEKDALRIGAEIAEALAAAHRQGIVHRDVKPANVMLTRSGVKLLDFGLARLLRTSAPSGEAESATTGLDRDVVAGTLPYMAPEQLEGREADARADVWALACVLFEMLAGRKAFDASSRAGLIAAIEKDEPPSLPPDGHAASPALDRLARQCLRKDPAERWQSAQDLALRLREIAERNAEAVARRPARKGSRLVVPVVAGALMLALFAGVVAIRLWPRPTLHLGAAPVVRTHLDLPSGTQLPGWQPTATPLPGWQPTATPLPGLPGGFPNRVSLALSPDGRHLVWSGSPDASLSKAALYLCPLETGEPVRMAGTDGAIEPFFSPDGRWIGFYSKGLLRKASVETGLVVDLTSERSEIGFGPSWAADGRIFFGSSTQGVRWIPCDGGSPQGLTTPDPGREVGHRLPRVLPGGRALLFTTLPHFFGLRAQIEVFSLRARARKVLVEDCADAYYLPSGHLICVRRGVLMAAPFDIDRLELKGALVPVLRGVCQALNANFSHGAGHYAVSDSGILVYAAGGVYPDPPFEALLTDETGRAEPLPGFDRPLASPQLRYSPDGRRIAFVERASSGRVWLFDVERQTCRALSTEGVAGAPRWSPDGTHLVVMWSKAGPLNLWSLPVEGGGQWERLTQSDVQDMPGSWSPDGHLLAFVRAPGEGHRSADVLLFRFGDRQTIPFLTSAARESFPEFSPDGRWLAYVSDESGRQEVYITSFPDRGQTYVVSQSGGTGPAWSRNGQRLFYFALDGVSMMSVKVRVGARLSLGSPTFLFRTESASLHGAWRGYDLHPDGHRFLFGNIKWEPLPPITRLNVVHNWFTELERLCPTRR